MLSSTTCNLYWISRTSLILSPCNCIFISGKRKSHKGFGWGSRADGGTLRFCFHLEIVDQTKPCVLAWCVDTEFSPECTTYVDILSWHLPSNAVGTQCVNIDPHFGLEECIDLILVKIESLKDIFREQIETKVCWNKVAAMKHKKNNYKERRVTDRFPIISNRYSLLCNDLKVMVPQSVQKG